MAKKYGIISDIHRVDPRYVLHGIEFLKNQNVEGIILNGDIVGDQFPQLNNQDYLAILLNYLGDSDIESYILPGSHEIVAEMEPVVNYFKEKFSNLIYTIENPVIDKEDHQLIFLPGSDWRPGKASSTGYSLENDQYETGLYKTKEGDLIRVINMGDLERYVHDSNKVILFSHVPRRFSNPVIAVDMAEFGEVESDFCLNGEEIKEGSVFPGPVGYQLANLGFPIKLKKENRGDKALGEILDEIGIKKHITGHFHESVHRAHNLKEEPLKEGEWTDELFFMASYMDALRMSLLEVDNQKVKFYRINLKNL